MSKVHAVLLIPAEGDPRGLLEKGPCGARPPIACWDGERWKSWTDNGWWWPVVPGRRALVLAWGGEPVWQGAVWTEVAAQDDWPVATSWRLLVKTLRVCVFNSTPWLRGGPTQRSMKMPRGIVGDLGTLVLLDAEGREVNDIPD